MKKVFWFLLGSVAAFWDWLSRPVGNYELPPEATAWRKRLGERSPFAEPPPPHPKLRCVPADAILVSPPRLAEMAETMKTVADALDENRCEGVGIHTAVALLRFAAAVLQRHSEKLDFMKTPGS